jgi:ankyrin repeat protein
MLVLDGSGDTLLFKAANLTAAAAGAPRGEKHPAPATPQSPQHALAEQIYHAASHGEYQALKKLLDRLAKERSPVVKRSVHDLAKGDGGHTALVAACELEKPQVAVNCARVLLDAHFNVRRTCDNKVTPLHAAVARSNTKLVELLLDAGADPTVTNADGKSAMDLAVEEGQPAGLDRLLKQRAPKNEQTARSGRAKDALASSSAAAPAAALPDHEDGSSSGVGGGKRGLSASVPSKGDASTSKVGSSALAAITEGEEGAESAEEDGGEELVSDDDDEEEVMCARARLEEASTAAELMEAIAQSRQYADGRTHQRRLVNEAVAAAHKRLKVQRLIQIDPLYGLGCELPADLKAWGEPTYTAHTILPSHHPVALPSDHPVATWQVHGSHDPTRRLLRLDAYGGRDDQGR